MLNLRLILQTDDLMICWLSCFFQVVCKRTYLCALLCILTLTSNVTYSSRDSGSEQCKRISQQ